MMMMIMSSLYLCLIWLTLSPCCVALEDGLDWVQSLPSCYNTSHSKADNYVPFFSVPDESLNFNFADGATNFRLVLGSLWKALGDTATDNDNNGLAFAYTTITKEGTFRTTTTTTTNHDAGPAELVYIISGKARVTVTDVGGGPSSFSETFTLATGQAFVALAGYLYSYEKIHDDHENHPDEPLVALSIYDDTTMPSHDAPQIPKDFMPHVLAKALQEPLHQVQGRLRSTNGSTHAIPAEESDFPYIAPPLYMETAPRAEANGHVKTGFWTASNFKALASTKFSFAVTELAPGATLEPYWVNNAQEMVFVISGRSLWVQRGDVNRDDVRCQDAFMIHQGDLAWHEPELEWYIENRGLQPAILLRVFTYNAPTITTLQDALPPKASQAMS